VVAFLLFCILLAVCPPLRKAVGLLFWILVIAIAWNWPRDERPAGGPAPAVQVQVEGPAPPAVIDELPVPYGSRRDVLPGVNFDPVQPAPGHWQGPRQPRPYRQQ
jgi:hypothetical protein